MSRRQALASRFDDDFTDRVFSLEPYASDAGRDAYNDTDPL